MIIQQIPAGDISLYITAFNIETLEVTFRRSDSPGYEQIEVIKPDGDFINLSTYKVPITFLQKFINENKDECTRETDNVES